MSRWFRHYAGMMRDDKLVRVALRSKQTIERVIWVWGAILESAAEIDDDGRYDFDPGEAAYFLRADEDELLLVLAALENAGHVAQGRVVKWGGRQFKSDRSADRQRKYRQSGKGAGSDDDGEGRVGATDDGVTSLSRHGDAPETETELETDTPPLAPRKRGQGATAIPKDWEAPPVSTLTPKARACAEQWTQASYETVAEGFVLYWQRTGKRTKCWRATWCGWVLREHSKVMRDQKFGNAAPDGPKGKADPAAIRKSQLETAELYDRMGRTAEAEEIRRTYAEPADREMVAAIAALPKIGRAA